MRSIKISLLISVSSIVFALLICELAVRLSGLWVVVDFQDRDYFVSRDIPNIPYLLKPNLRTQWAGGDICSNNEGLRNCSDYPKDHPNSRRILVIGDSLIFGYGVGQHQTITAHLQKLLSRGSLKEDGAPLEVINAGIEGFSAVNESAAIDYFVERYTPDMVVWLLIPNDWDDQLSVTADGTMTTNRGNYSAAAQWLQMTWGVQEECIHYENILQDMGTTQQSWAQGKPIHEAPSKASFAKHSYLYALISSLYRPSATKTSLKTGPCYPIRKRTQLAEWPLLPELEAIHVSPFFSERFEQSISKAVSTTTRHKIPLLILGMDVPLNPDLVAGSDSAVVDDIVSYLDMDFDNFRRRYNLRWDPHFTSAGNTLLAQAMYSALARNKFITPVSTQETLPYRSRVKYWEAYQAWRKDFIASFIFKEIDFENFRNVHQLVGGLYPPRSFPIKPGAYVSLILKRPASASRITLQGDNRTQNKQLITCDITGQNSTRISIPSGTFTETVALTPHIQPNSALVDVKISCDQEQCQNIALHRVGFE